MEPDWVARGIALGACLAAAANATVSWFSYRRNRTQVIVGVQHEFQIMDATGKKPKEVPVESLKIAFDIQNRAAEPVQIFGLGLLIPGCSAPWVVLDPSLYGEPNVPLTIAAGHRQVWRVNCLDLANYLNRFSGGEALSFRLLVRLGGNDQLIQSDSVPLAPFHEESFAAATALIRKAAIGSDR